MPHITPSQSTTSMNTHDAHADWKTCTERSMEWGHGTQGLHSMMNAREKQHPGTHSVTKSATPESWGMGRGALLLTAGIQKHTHQKSTHAGCTCMEKRQHNVHTTTQGKPFAGQHASPQTTDTLAARTSTEKCHLDDDQNGVKTQSLKPIHLSKQQPPHQLCTQHTGGFLQPEVQPGW